MALKKPIVVDDESPGILQSLDRYWFDHGSPTTLGLFRILIGSLSFLNCFLLWLHWESWFSEKGYVPAWLGQLWLDPNYPLFSEPSLHKITIPRIDLLNGVTDARIAIPFFFLITLFSLTTALGLWTRFSTIALAIGVVSLQHRNAAILHGGDTVLRVSVLYLALAPCGLACSVDRLIGLWKGTIAPVPIKVSLWAQRLVCYNTALVYFTTVWLKYFGTFWRQGIATYFPSRLAEFYRFPVPRFVNEVPFVYLTTYGTLIIEFALATLVFFRPLRKYVLLAGVLMHGYIEYSMNIPLFSFLMVSCYLCFYDGEEVSAWAERLGHRMRRWRTVVRFPHGSQLRPSSAAYLDAVDPLKLVTYASSADTSWHGERADGSEMPYAVASWSRSLGAYLIAWIPGVWHRILHKSLEAAPVQEASSVVEEEVRPPRKGKKARR
ncbi:HTTM domain-containing protein [Fimbriimonas ginsengisoli]|uniref:HTTM-like domain-containing protein n=1 Tax=Fimbriimonas ginsengisoli Gsoil 348 TaxID=661478 RepID=A0A068NKT2_FIMGI|nr:HTTM domain-containing protein [Fimbriimonas ginsengisoli]AIE83405.1 hypothetical protein OP10G_0037 [Fimbriimonas ginsengisoli Gsoil 348]